MTMENFTFGLVFGGVTGIIAAAVITFIIAVIVTMYKEEADKKKENFLVKFTCVNKVTNESFEDIATIIGAKSEAEAICMLKEYLRQCGHNENAEQSDWVIEAAPQIFNLGRSSVLCTRYYD